MENILEEIAQIDSGEDELHKLKILNETLEEFADRVKVSNEKHLEHITTILNNKIRNNHEYNKVINNFLDKYVSEDKKEKAKNDLIYILTGELLGILKGLSQTKCSIM